MVMSDYKRVESQPWHTLTLCFQELLHSGHDTEVAVEVEFALDSPTSDCTLTAVRDVFCDQQCAVYQLASMVNTKVPEISVCIVSMTLATKGISINTHALDHHGHERLNNTDSVGYKNVATRGILTEAYYDQYMLTTSWPRLCSRTL
jgi:hypothetical protein